MKLLSKILLLLLLPSFVKAQNRRQMDSAYLVLQHATNDTIRMGAYSMLGFFYDDINIDSGLYNCNKGIALAEKLDLPLNKAEIMAFMIWPLMKMGNYPEALKVINRALEIAEDPSNEKNTWNLKKGQTPQMYRHSVVNWLYLALLELYGYTDNYEKLIATALKLETLYTSAGDALGLTNVYNDIGDGYLKLNKFDSALFYQQKSLDMYPKVAIEDRKFEGVGYMTLGEIYEKMGNKDLAWKNYNKAILVSEQRENPRHTGVACVQLANLYQSVKETDSVFVYAKKALEAFTLGGYEKEKAIVYRLISDYYHDRHNTDSSFAYLQLAAKLNDSLTQIEKTRLREFQIAAFNQQLELQQQGQKRIEQEGKIKTFAIIALIAVFSTIGFLLYRNNRQKQKANQALQEKNSEIAQTLSELKSTQTQLIQSEKMASLGELTAGIAHEIQNPLNFVNNFSEVNGELIKELKDEVIKGNLEEVTAIANDIESNSEKINHHGKRADAIVKGMLQHSQSTSGAKEPTDINKLADEYLRLAYHGLRGKDKSFNATMKTDFDETIGNFNIIPQDIGRVLLNLYNNAFYSVNEKSKQQTEGYEPIVLVSSKKVNNQVEIKVKDNGNGIPQKIVDKIFQPFFTTKPTGQGTGLGLSLSYDIIKAHGAEIKVETKEGEGSEFIIQLPN